MLRNEKILITGPTSQVAMPLARELARHNEVHGLARLSRDADVARLREIGVRPLRLDLASAALDAVPDDFTYVVNMAVVKTGGFAYDLAANAEGAGRLVAHCRRAKGFLHVSSGGVYRYAGQRALREDDRLGGRALLRVEEWETALTSARPIRSSCPKGCRASTASAPSTWCRA
ncbi:MAG: NAD-dependent epimerase/dehydratase family protein [Deltaproteobacteria bacterium]|nr:NAD-dependent epimerase/dehydratase family protein [Deltaproteobacteria bacterium]